MFTEESINEQYVLSTAKAMAVAARTAPKARGIDNLVIRILDKEDIKKVSEQLKKDYESTNAEFLLRDSENILSAPYMLLVATKVSVLGLDCAYCGFKTCEEKVKAGKNIPCFFNSEDLGLAIGSACSVAQDRKVDSRVMFSAGSAATRAGFVDDCVQCLAISLSATAKNPFFDRK